MAQEDISNLFRGSQLGSRLTRQTQGDYSDDSDDNNYGEERDDTDYVVNDSDLELNYSDYSDDISEDLNAELDDLIADQEEDTFSDEMTFLEDLLQSLRDLNRGKIDWSEMDVNDLVNKFLKHPQECMKMVVDELNLIGNHIQT